MAQPLTTLDGLLNKRVALEQPSSGYRVAVDTVLLASAVPALPGDKILDLGCGVGGAMLALTCRVPDLTGVGVDIQAELVVLCRRNIGRNSFAAGLDVRFEDATQLPDDLQNAFDHVLMNPPYHQDDRHDVSEDEMKRGANSEKTGELPLWIASAALALRPSGTLTLIHRADRTEEILSLLTPAFGDIWVLPVVPREGNDPKRVIIRARLDAVYAVRKGRSFVLHKESGAYSEEAEQVLRHCQALVFQSP